MIETMADAYFRLYFPWPKNTADKFASMEEHYQRWEAIRKAEHAASNAQGVLTVLRMRARRLDQSRAEVESICRTLAEMLASL